ncbi:MAG: hypothetical protein C0467_11120 [Planctomycetaceae bacterium]|nr:hypothetical protein [Planctomycetaceae bacterium]
MCQFISLSLLIALSPALFADERPSVGVTATKPGAPAIVEVRGLPREMLTRLKAAQLTPKEWAPIFRVVVAGGTNDELLARTPLAGTYTLTDTGVRFDPQFPLVPGREYIAVLHDRPKGPPMLVTVALPKPVPGPRVAISAVYPSANRLPENTLRFYIHFSGPVARGDVYKHLKLIRDDGVEVKEPFLELPEELWSTEGDRLTILFHPGRVKQGLVPREDDGAVLEQGRTYTLSISDKWEDTEGRPLVSGVKKTFTATASDHEPVDLGVWALAAPRAGSDSPLIVKLPKPLDHAMLGRVVWVVDAAGNRVPGDLTVGGGERVLTFAPKKPWAKGAYRLVADTRLEDVCGNRVGEPFEVDERTSPKERTGEKTADRVFTVK